jgi:multidrug efflux system membrane fusion protein
MARNRRLSSRHAPVSAASLCIAAMALGACQRAPRPAPLAEPVVSLVVHSAPMDEVAPIRYPVETAARYSTVMSFRIGGKLIERRVRLGDAVHKGDVIACLDPVDAQKQLAGAQAALDAASHRLFFAKQQLDRDQTQYTQQLIAQNQLEQTQDGYSAALAAREQAADQLVLAQNTLHYNSLVADHNGVITSENADTGQVVSAGQAIYGLAWSDDIDVILDAAASDLPQLTIGQAATVSFPPLPNRRFEARVREVSPAADPQSRTYRVKLTLIEPKDEVRLGMTGDATLTRAASMRQASPALVGIPATALFHQGKNPAVWVIRSGDSVLELRPVRVRSYGERTVYVDDGLRDGDNIVAAGVHTVYAGERVRAVKPLFADDESHGNTAGSPP